MSTRIIRDAFSGEDPARLPVQTVDKSEFVARAGFRRVVVRLEPNPICVTCNAAPSCRGVDVGENCPDDPTA